MEDLNKNQFVYKREIQDPTPEGETVAPPVRIVYDSFNIENVLRTITMDDGRLLVLLDDLHERNQDVPKMNKLTRQPMINKKGFPIMEKVRDTFQSEIYLSEKEGQQFLKLTAVNDYE
jgi:hypothetical protein